MAEQEKKKSDKAGGNKRRVASYWSQRNQLRVAERKLRATLRSGGPIQALAWATSREVIYLLRKLENEHIGGKPTRIAILAKAALTDEAKKAAGERTVVAAIPESHKARGGSIVASATPAKKKRGRFAAAESSD